jgi:tRNA-splicing ligase RtcB (3'-phosphate/5'-hydroxy nucleic acid ligase)
LPLVDVAKQLSEVTWEIPTSYKQGMRVPAKIYATKKLLEGMDSGVIEQVTNLACLPGIVRNAYAMADAHWGYGFPIGGVAAFDLESGVISPGGVGFDINCLHPDSRIYDANGIWVPIGRADIRSRGFVTFDPKSGKRPTRAITRQERHESGSVLKLRTQNGRTLMLTSDHQVLTRNGMVEAGRLSLEDSVLTDGIEGIAFTPPADLRIVSPDDLNRAMDAMGITESGDARGQVMNHLKARSLDSVRLTDPRIAELLKLLGFVFGGGTIPEMAKNHHVAFYGKPEDLDDVARDLDSLGFGSHRYHRDRHSKSRPAYGLSEFDFAEDSLFASSTAFAVLIVALGAPYGKKTAKPYRLPHWLFFSEAWQRKLFLGAYFGAELSRPRTVNGYDFQMPLFSVSKLETLAENALVLVEDFHKMLLSLGVETSVATRVAGNYYGGVDGPSVGFRVGILSNTPNLLRFFGKVGYLYNREKQRLSSLASSYLSYVQSIREERDPIREEAVAMYADGTPAREVVAALATTAAGSSFIRHSIWSGRGSARPWKSLKFQEYAQKFEHERTGCVYDRVSSIEAVPYEGPVYDVTIGDENHNFISEGVVVSNCGMRLIRTNLHYSEVKSHVKELVDLIFRLVPAGVGVKGSLRISEPQFDEVMKYGVKWCAENGLAWEDDPSHVEEGGFIKGADPSKVSRQARSRGIDQLGTLGSGNHYLEIQVVDPPRFFDRDLAKKFGVVHEDQVVVMVHCGSRGFGHQVGTDYLRVFDGAMKRYGISVRDRELACAPYSSKEGKDYYGAMVCAANMAFTNRQVIVQKVREAFSRVFHRDAEALDMHLIYDVCHNVAKVERHSYDGVNGEFLVHRKGATRSFGPGHPDIPSAYREVGQPVIIGGSMETGSYLLVGTQKAMEETFGSTAHGSGRTMSRTAAKRDFSGPDLQRKMLERGIYVKSATMDGLAEEAGMAYKDISEVVETMDIAGISKKVVALRPVGNIKG